MKKILLLLLLMMTPNVFAEWIVVGDNDNDDDRTTYIDLGTLKKVGNKVNILLLYDYDAIQMLGAVEYSSYASHEQFDCAEQTSRTLDVNWYAGNMTHGDIVYSDLNLKAEPKLIIPGSIDETFFNIACSKN